MTTHRIGPPPPAFGLPPAPGISDAGTTRRRNGSLRAATLAAVWAATLVGMLALLLIDRVGDSGVAGEVHTLYRRWYEQLVQGAFPLDDVTWQYPPGAALIFLSPGVCLTSRHTTQRPVALLMLPAAALSALAYPLLYDDVLAGSPLGLLLAAALLSCHRLWAATATRSG